MSQNLFQIESVKIHSQVKCEQHTWFQRKIMKLFGISATVFYDAQFKVRLYKAGYLVPNDVILLGNEASPIFRVIAKNTDLHEYVVIPNGIMTNEGIKHALTKTHGFLWGRTCTESKFKRLKPIN